MTALTALGLQAFTTSVQEVVEMGLLYTNKPILDLGKDIRSTFKMEDGVFKMFNSKTI